MKTHHVFRLLLASVFGAVMLFAVFGFNHQPNQTVNANTALRLEAPFFVGVARAEGTTPATSIIESEAGMSAYFTATTSISLNDVRGLFRTIETETADYIIGSVPVANYPETEDVHVYVHRDGWILAYYLKADPVGKIYDWRQYHNSGRTNISTKLENTVALVAGQAGSPFTNAAYYDFRYPNATNLTLIVEWAYSAQDSFEVKLPSSFAYYERSWSLTAASGNQRAYYLDGAVIGSDFAASWVTSQGTLSAVQLLPDQFHTINVSGTDYTYGGLALVYRVP